MEWESPPGAWLLHHAVADVVQAEACFHPAWPLPASRILGAAGSDAPRSVVAIPGQWDDARAFPAPIYGWCTAGFDTADLQDAKAVLEELEE